MTRVFPTLLRRLWLDERGQGLFEYVWLIALVAVLAVATVTSLGQQIYDSFYEPASNLFG